MVRKLTVEERNLIDQVVKSLGTSKSQIIKKFSKEGEFTKNYAASRFYGLTGLSQEEALVLYNVLEKNSSLEFLKDYKPIESQPETKRQKIESAKESREVSETKSLVEQAKENLVDAYLGQIKIHYLSSDLYKKSQIEGKLELLVNKLEKGEPIENLQSGRLKQSSFEGTTARKIRHDLHLSLSELSARMGFTDPSKIRSSKVTINRFENNHAPNRPRGVLVLQYLNWLKEQGYNPYNL